MSAAPDIRIVAECASGHSQVLTYSASLGREWVEAQAGLLDGTSSMYRFSPIGTSSMIGRCGLCGAQIKCRVEEEA